MFKQLFNFLKRVIQTKALCAETAQILLLFSFSTQDFTLSCSTLHENKLFRSNNVSMLENTYVHHSKKKKYLLDFHAKCIEKNGQVLLSQKKKILPPTSLTST